MVGLGRALEFVYTGELKAERAYEWGMLNHLVASEELEAFTRDLCGRMMAIPPMVQWISKRIMRASLDTSMETTMVMTSNAGGILNGSEDAKEARRAFMEKRSEEHTSELQSLMRISYAVFCLKKKKNQNITKT